MSDHTPAGGHPSCDIEALNSLLRGEISAVETYDEALAKFTAEAIATDLQRIRDEHQRAVVALRDRVAAFGGTPAHGSGGWGGFASAVTEAAKLLGPATTLSALKQGEEHGINRYETALGNDGVDADCKTLIRSDLLPKCRTHVTELDRLLGSSN